MPWEAVSLMSLRKEFIYLVMKDSCCFSELCERFKISRKTGYKWVKRFLNQGESGLKDQPRKPKTSPKKTPSELEEKVLEMRRRHPAWGGRKIAYRLKDLGQKKPPAPSTITGILKRQGYLDPKETPKHQAWHRFEAENPNDLWQMDFKGHFEAAEGRCHPLTILDDHSRYSVCLQTCSDQTGATVERYLIAVFRRYGMPLRMGVDNGSPWGCDAEHPYTSLTVWLIRLSIRVSHSRPAHPQTLGKDERFHRSLKAEVLQYCTGAAMEICQQRFNQWRDVYNLERPHEALDMQVPASRFQVSSRGFPETLPPIEYGPDDLVRKVQQKGEIYCHGKGYPVGKAFRGQYVALRPTSVDGVMDVFYCNQIIHHIDFRKPPG